jgi:glutamine amidotransferase
MTERYQRTAPVGIVDYGAGNIFSLTAALTRQGLAYEMVSEPEALTQYERIIIPGVGHAGKAMAKLQASNMVEAIRQYTRPVLGICLGMQLLTRFSEEGNQELLNLIPLQTAAFKNKIRLKVPHMGWNTLQIGDSSGLLDQIPDSTYFYFVHSFYIEYNPKFTIASCEYGIKFSAIIQKDNYYGVQFHPEKSGIAGEQLLRNFLTL